MDLSKLVPVEAIKNKTAARKSKAEEKRLLNAEKKAAKEVAKENKNISASNDALKAGAMMSQRSYENKATVTSKESVEKIQKQPVKEVQRQMNQPKETILQPKINQQKPHSGPAASNNGNIEQQMKRSSTVRVWTKGGGEVSQTMPRNNTGATPMESRSVQGNNKERGTTNNAGKGKKELLNTRALLRGLEEDE